MLAARAPVRTADRELDRVPIHEGRVRMATGSRGSRACGVCFQGLSSYVVGVVVAVNVDGPDMHGSRPDRDIMPMRRCSRRGYSTCTPSVSHPPVEPPVPSPEPNSRRCLEIAFRYRESARSVIASPYGPLFAELTAYESSKYGVGCSMRTSIIRGKCGPFQSL